MIPAPQSRATRLARRSVRRPGTGTGPGTGPGIGAAALLALALGLGASACATPSGAPAAGPDASSDSAAAEAAPAAPEGIRGGDPLTADEIQEHVDILASDAFEGRGAATDGERKAGAYLVSLLEQLPGVEPGGDEGGWYQAFPITVNQPGAVYDHDRAQNVVAVLPGSDPELAHEVIVIGAHYDHVGPEGRHGGSLSGSREIHNGADDNASGSAVVYELAETFATADVPPRRTIVFQWYSGEELGLLGSRWWVANPSVPLDDVVAMINMDMIGRLQGGTLLIGGTGSSPVLEEIVADLEGFEDLAFVLDPPGNAPSDNSSFYEQGIPVLFLFTGVHEDYHAPGDDPEKLNAPGTAKVGRLAREIVVRLDARDERPPFRLAPGMANYWMPKVDYGLTLDAPPEDAPGVARIAVLVPGSSAGRARDAEGRGLQEGDVILSVDGQLLRSLEELEAVLADVDDRRTPKQLGVLRPTDDDDWELLELELVPEIK